MKDLIIFLKYVLQQELIIFDDGILKYDDVKRRQETIDNLLIDV